jgi:hypothetical protein
LERIQVSSPCANPILAGRAIRHQSSLSIASNTKRQSPHICFQALNASYFLFQAKMHSISYFRQRMQDIRGVQASLYSYAVPQELDRQAMQSFLAQLRQHYSTQGVYERIGAGTPDLPARDIY